MVEQWAEAHEDHDVFKPGVQVRVAFESLSQMLRCGELGEAIGHTNGEICVQLEKATAGIVMPAEMLMGTAGSSKYKPLQKFSAAVI